MTTDLMLTGPRWSSAVVCPRMAAYQGLGVEGDPYPEDVLRRFGRGRRIGRAMAEEVAATLGAQGRQAILEREVPWPAADPVGTGHADIDIPDESTVIEVVSTEGCALPPHKARQVAGYAINLGREQARVLSVDPKTGDDKAYPVNVEAFRPVVERIEGQVAAAIHGGPLPDRFEGASPGGYPCMDCPFRRGCFHDWTPPPIGRLPEAGEDFQALLDIEREASKSKKLTAALERDREEIRARLAGRMEDGMDYIEDGVRVRRTTVAGRRSLSLTAMEAAGFELTPQQQEFLSVGGGYDRWTVRAVES